MKRKAVLEWAWVIIQLASIPIIFYLFVIYVSPNVPQLIPAEYSWLPLLVLFGIAGFCIYELKRYSGLRGGL